MDSDLNFYIQYCISMKKLLSTIIKFTVLSAVVTEKEVPSFNLMLCILYIIFPSWTLNLLTWRIWWAPNNASKWQMGFNSAFKGLKQH